MIWLRVVHIVAGIFWVGSAIFSALFLLPTARTAGAEGGRFVARLMQRVGPALGVAMVLTVIPGFIMYGRLSAGFSKTWVTSPTGLALGAGAVAALLAVLLGAAINAPARTRIVALSKGAETQGGTPSASAAAELAKLQGRIERGAQIVALLLVVAAGAMAVARYL
jgi:uncharacterized membrane protein